MPAMVRAVDGSFIQEGDRIEIHPAHDYVMFVGRYARVTSVGRRWVHVEIERLDATYRGKLAPAYILRKVPTS